MENTVDPDIGSERRPTDSEDGIQHSDSSDSGIYDREIKALQRTLQHLGVDDTKTGAHGASGTTQSKADRTPDEEDSEAAEELTDDFVPTHLVSVSPARHMALSSRRRSDPGRLSLLHSRSPFGSSDSSEDDELPERSPRARSPRRFFSVLPEDECYPSGGLSIETRNIPGWASPRRRLYRQSTNFVEDNPRRGRTRRSNSLPLPDRSALGEAIGALATHAGEPHPAASPRQPPLNKRNRCISIDEPALEAIMEENMVTALQKNQKSGIRRFSVPTARPARRVHLPQKISP